MITSDMLTSQIRTYSCRSIQSLHPLNNNSSHTSSSVGQVNKGNAHSRSGPIWVKHVLALGAKKGGQLSLGFVCFTTSIGEVLNTTFIFYISLI